MPRIGILSPSITTGDAVSNDALGMYEVLIRRGYDVRVFCETHAVDKPKEFDAGRLARFLNHADDLIICHYSRGWNPGVSLLRELNCRNVMKYHNITPREF